ncbi:MAG: hypothetical protein HY918_02920 [Candidatus Doudnabacteria bacterium]|nr:hypothetical protein [Candidatus Doudnabacteria bacterium]
MFGRGSSPEFNSINPDSYTTDETKKENKEKSTDGNKKKLRDFFKRNKSKEKEKQPENEASANSDSAGEVLVGEIVSDDEIPQYIKDGVSNPQTAQEAASAINEKSVFGQKLKKTWETLKPVVASAAAGAAVRSATKFALKRTLDFGTVGASAGAGAVVGGGMEFYKQNKAENRRLFNLETYNKTLDGYKEMSALEKAESYVAITEALEQRGLDRGQHAELSARLTTLKVALENKTEWESLPEAERLLKYMKAREQAEREELPKAMKKEAGKILKDLFKDKNLNKNWKKISTHTIKGAVIGAGAGALGAWAFDHFIGSAVDSHHSAQVVAEKAAEAAKSNLAHQAETVVNLPSSQDTQELHKTVWDTAKHFLESHGVKHPSVKDLNEAMITICKENNIEITGHHPGAAGGTWYEGFNHAHQEGANTIKDINLKDGVELKGFDKLGDIIAKAGGTVPRPTEVKLSWPVDLHGLHPSSNGPVEVSAARAAEALSSQDQSLRKITLIIGGGIAVAAEAMHYISWQKKQKEKKSLTQIESNTSPQEPTQPSPAQESVPPKEQTQTNKPGVWDKINSKIKRVPVEKTLDALKLESEKKLEAAKKEAENLYLKENERMQALEKFVYSYQAQTEPKAEKEEQYEKLRDKLGKIYNKEAQMRLMENMSLDEQKDFTEFWKNFTLDLQDRYQKAEVRAAQIWSQEAGSIKENEPKPDAGGDEAPKKAKTAPANKPGALPKNNENKPAQKPGEQVKPASLGSEVGKSNAKEKADRKTELLQEMKDLGLMRPDATKKNFSNEERIALNKFVYLMQEKDTSLLQSVYGEAAFEKRKVLTSAFRGLNQNKPELLMKFCRDALALADQNKDNGEGIKKMLTEMKAINAEIAKIVDEEIKKHKAPVKKRKK